MPHKRARLREKYNLSFMPARPRKLLRRFAAGQKNLIFLFPSKFVRWNLCRTNGQDFAKDKIYLFCLFFRECCKQSHRLREKQNALFLLARPRKLLRRFAARVSCCGASPPGIEKINDINDCIKLTITCANLRQHAEIRLKTHFH